MRILDIIMSFPGIALARRRSCSVSRQLGARRIIFAIGFLYIPQIARIVRANVVSRVRSRTTSAPSSFPAPAPPGSS